MPTYAMPAAGRAGRPGSRGDLQRLLVGRRAPRPGGPGRAGPGRGRGSRQPTRSRSPAARHWAMLAATARSASSSRPRSQSATPGALGDRVQHPLALADLGQGLRRERGRSLGVAAELREVGTREIAIVAGTFASRLAPGRPTARTAHRRPDAERALGGSQQRLDRLDAAAERASPPGPATAAAGTDQLGGQRREPPLERRALAAQETARRSAARSAGPPRRRPRRPARAARRRRRARAPRARRPRCGAAARTRSGRSCCRRARSRSANRWW